MSFADAAAWAGRWGSRVECLGRAGHINAESGFGPWPEGLRLLAELRASGDSAPALRCRAG
jgi:predicted alpha/beta hydrolase family esterase